MKQRRTDEQAKEALKAHHITGDTTKIIKEYASDLLDARAQLDIAVKALEDASVILAKADGDYETLCAIRAALKEIQE